MSEISLQPDSRPRNSILDGWRGVLSLWVMFGHICLYVHLDLPVLTAPGYAVDGFILLSGYFIQASLLSLNRKYELKGAIKAFYIHRFMRTWPVYACVLIGLFLILYLNYNYSFEGSIIENNTMLVFFSNLTLVSALIPSLVSSTPIPSWSLSLEFQFYLIYPLIYTLNLSRSTIFLVFIFLLALLSPLLLGNYSEPGVFAHFGLPSILSYRLYYFLAGVVWFNYRNEPLNRTLVIMLAGIFIINPFTAILIVCIFISNSVLCDTAIAGILKGRLFQLIGRISYSLYLIHYPIIIICGWFLSHLGFAKWDQFFKTVSMLSLTILISISLSYLIFVLLEQRFILMGRTWEKRAVK